MDSKYIQFDNEVANLLFKNKISILFSTYQANQLMVIGSNDGTHIQQSPIPVEKPMGIAVKNNKLAVATKDEIHFFAKNDELVSSLKNNTGKIDSIYVFRGAYNTGFLDIHDITYAKKELWGINTLFSCLCTFDLESNFTKRWSPYFIDKLVPEDRCHLNGLAMKNGKPKYVTALSSTNTKEGWRKNIMENGILMDVEKNDIILEGLAMPHSPTIINNNLYLLESGNGRLIKVSIEKKSFEVIYEFNKFVRGMKYSKGLLFVGVSKIRENSKAFNDLDVVYSSKNAGIIILDMKTKTTRGKITYSEIIEEIYDVNLIEGFCKTGIITRSNEKSKNLIITPNQIFWRDLKNKRN